MKSNVNLKEYNIYSDIETNLHVAIRLENVKAIQDTVRNFKGVENVPNDYQIKGIYLENTSENEYNMINSNEVEIKIKNLRFDNL